MERWEQPGYLDIVQATATPAGRLTVLFADETWVEFDGHRLLPPGVCEARWDELSIDEAGDFVLVPTAGEPVDLPADRIRILTDPEYAEHWARLAADEERRIGRRLRTLRERRGLTGKDVAQRAGIAPMSLSRIELGYHDVVLPTLAKLLAALGAFWDDLAVSEETEAKPRPRRGRRATPERSLSARRR